MLDPGGKPLEFPPEPMPDPAFAPVPVTPDEPPGTAPFDPAFVMALLGFVLIGVFAMLTIDAGAGQLHTVPKTVSPFANPRYTVTCAAIVVTS